MSDLTEAAARRRAWQKWFASPASRMGVDPYANALDDRREDAYLLADAWLAEHSEDDGEAVTEEWLESIAEFNDNAHEFIWEITSEDTTTGDASGSTLQIDWGELLGGALASLHSFSPDGSVKIWLRSPVETRGHVRRLLAALGVQREGE